MYAIGPLLPPALLKQSWIRHCLTANNGPSTKMGPRPPTSYIRPCIILSLVSRSNSLSPYYHTALSLPTSPVCSVVWHCSSCLRNSFSHSYIAPTKNWQLQDHIFAFTPKFGISLAPTSGLHYTADKRGSVGSCSMVHNITIKDYNQNMPLFHFLVF